MRLLRRARHRLSSLCLQPRALPEDVSQVFTDERQRRGLFPQGRFPAARGAARVSARLVAERGSQGRAEGLWRCPHRRSLPFLAQWHECLKTDGPETLPEASC